MSKEQQSVATSDTNSAVAIYNTHAEAEAAIKELQKSGFDMKRLSIVGKDYHTEENVVSTCQPVIGNGRRSPTDAKHRGAVTAKAAGRARL
jgi:hypothetical protein